MTKLPKDLEVKRDEAHETWGIKMLSQSGMRDTAQNRKQLPRLGKPPYDAGFNACYVLLGELLYKEQEENKALLKDIAAQAERIQELEIQLDNAQYEAMGEEL